MVSKCFPLTVALDQCTEFFLLPNNLQLSPLPSMISKRQIAVSSTWNSEVHIAWIGDLFKERYKIIRTTIIC